MLSDSKLQAVVGDADEFIRFLAPATVLVTPTETVTISRDPDDDRLVEAALATQADVIVTGDQDLLTLGHIGQIRALTPRTPRRAPLGHRTPTSQTRSNYGRKRLRLHPHITVVRGSMVRCGDPQAHTTPDLGTLNGRTLTWRGGWP